MKNSLLFSMIIVALGASLLISLALGRYEIDLRTLGQLLLWKFFTIGTAPHEVALLSNIVFDIRLPRILAVVLVGAALSVSGGAFQAMFVNPLVSPGILGVLAGASFGAALGIMISNSWLGVQLFSFTFGFVAVLVALGVAKIYGRSGSQTILLVLGGVISSSLFSALLSTVKYVADPYNKLPTIVYWLMGSFSAVDMKTLSSVAMPLILSTIVLSLMGKYLNVLSLGDDDAKALGIRVAWVRNSAILLATLLSTLTVVVAGMIGWVGLIIPHIARFLVGADNRVLLPMCALLGATFLVIVDTLCRTSMSVEIPIGIATSLIGIPIFIFALKNAKKGFA
ncbi:iron chelate uptake transporter (FeCT) family transport system permease [Sulfurospirillum diekertiae]|uniref:Iron chelate uptake transporter (FeCT) family transport system permease n=1 Tax=Sulfurospirillum diekertiae TaxID=1854492 RepID=A0A290HGU9_9BACT|nr:iron ABC transporter permease [Sulfurospirillum diekertiae]ATB70657.1 iron chelate uptake transporter (FeCT) family transport system permease [Sulfurospirillum diekertiae]